MTRDTLRDVNPPKGGTQYTFEQAQRMVPAFAGMAPVPPYAARNRRTASSHSKR